MRSDSRLSRMLHVLIHMDESDGPLTSDTIARMLGTNPVVVRRTMAGLRDKGYVHSGKGHGGGWTLARRLDEITLRDVYRSLGEPSVFALGPTADHPRCLVEQAVNAAVDEALDEAEALLLRRFAAVSVGDIARDFRARLGLRTMAESG
ncbi:transcriptional regulator [Kaistia algarum]|uniref:Rrf2 family transcriptional regulator n=1 Tax=Kaistia algarum TaxID=2083279 RepID=UPI000CE76764|nr:Rrf2 family transcriptional regulator [Kaistia algarum]MCX5515211.1 Rrf2 family transcriptional regulator [Kaistia algarum]PPE79926.1 transcriptional regulator [Kaistia algarum]